MAKRIFYAHRLITEEAHDIAFVNFMRGEGHVVETGFADDIERTDFSSYDLFILGNRATAPVDFGNKELLINLGCSVMSMCPFAAGDEWLGLGTSRSTSTNTLTRLQPAYKKVEEDYSGVLPNSITIGTSAIWTNSLTVVNAAATQIADNPSSATHKTIIIRDSNGQRRMFYGYTNASVYNAAGWDLFRKCINYMMGDANAFIRAFWGMASITNRGLTILKDLSPSNMKYRRLGSIELGHFSEEVSKVSFEANATPASEEKTVLEATIKKTLSGAPYFESIAERGIKYFVRFNGTIHSYSNEQWSATELISPLTESQFNELGIAENIPAEKWETITGDYDIILIKNTTPPNATPFTLPMQKNEAWLETGSLFEVEVAEGIQIDRIDGIKVL